MQLLGCRERLSRKEGGARETDLGDMVDIAGVESCGEYNRHLLAVIRKRSFLSIGRYRAA
jgi:hypothetical protein